jgi:hypothetical protein
MIGGGRTGDSRQRESRSDSGCDGFGPLSIQQKRSYSLLVSEDNLCVAKTFYAALNNKGFIGISLVLVGIALEHSRRPNRSLRRNFTGEMIAGA